MQETLQNQLEKMNEKEFQKDLIQWFEKEMRDLPWRKNQDPYRVWVSEIMLQQTRVDTVIPYYNRFMEQFPTIEALAFAPEEKVLKAWEGLGYYSRARNLQSAVREVHEQYGGQVPKDPKEISALKGVGPYTAGAILSIAYDIPEPAVDGNVMRVLSRILSLWDDIAKPSSRKIFEEAVRHLINKENPSYFNQAMMELGALICTPTSPSCLLCPVQEHCLAFSEGIQRDLPVKTKKKSTKVIDLLTVMVQNQDGDWLMNQRPAQGLLANLWEFPSFEKQQEQESAVQIQEFLKTDFNVEAVVDAEPVLVQDHVFSHLTWKMVIFKAKTKDQTSIGDRAAWMNREAIERVALPVSHRKIWNHYLST
ncbi:A/G-specific adenine glycosylase [Jeotgalibacillus proteolyticus]|uniref:Adenine DNA glycosylase n=1 Tax=Jeotgalibacillus proteolyticus TaxID=2082395 RepID=A0A2S5G7A6_9BACL|nr:A/G-specific adenine glycosylase [Jeotgalibacillus proteolyticus]PPA68833.1 A/G-specific adenine glycosylase [Jeotgalibacillus proteolyticus]